MMVRPKVVHITLLNWTSDLFPSLSRAPGHKQSQLLTRTGTLSRKSRELESVRRCVLKGGGNTPKTLVLKCVIAAAWETASISNEVSGRSFQMNKKTNQT